MQALRRHLRLISASRQYLGPHILAASSPTCDTGLTQWRNRVARADLIARGRALAYRTRYIDPAALALDGAPSSLHATTEVDVMNAVRVLHGAEAIVIDGPRR